MKNKSKYIKYIGNIVTIVAIIFIIRKMLSYDISSYNIFSVKNIAIFGIILIGYMGSVVLNTYPWLQIVQIISGKRIPFFQATLVSVRSNVLKYIPGNVFQYIGKNELALKSNVEHSEVAFSTIFDVLLMLIVAFVTGAILVGDYFVEIVTSYISLPTVLIIVAAGVAVLVVLIMILKKRIIVFFSQIIKNLSKKENIFKLITCIAYYLIQNIFTGMLYLLVLCTISGMGMGQLPWLHILGANIISGVIGFLTPGAPGGIGIREMVMMLMTSGIMDGNTIMVTSVVFRIISILGDILAFAVVFGFDKIKSIGGRKCVK